MKVVVSFFIGVGTTFGLLLGWYLIVNPGVLAGHTIREWKDSKDQCVGLALDAIVIINDCKAGLTDCNETLKKCIEFKK